jgi:hypothetical protein
MLAFLLNFLEAWLGFTKSVEDFVNKFEDLLIFEFGIEEVKVMFGFYIVEHVIPVDIGFPQDRIDTHFVVIKFARICYKIFKNDRRRFKVYGQSFGRKIARDWFTHFLFGTFVAARSLPHFLLQIVRLIEKYFTLITFHNQSNYHNQASI